MESFNASYIKIKPADIQDNIIKLIAIDWMLVTAGTPENYNTMTASWGGFGYLWNKSVAFVFVRPTRYTYNFMESNTCFTLSFFEEKHRPVLQWAGTKSGRDVNKMKELPLSPTLTESGLVSFGEARLVLDCHKLYTQDIKPENFLEEDLVRHYPLRDFHRMYIAEIESCYSRLV
jgi:flavin reductase (DIM6/NTAB) family NADH-FMN oxidoreductase RutF